MLLLSNQTKGGSGITERRMNKLSKREDRKQKEKG